MDLRSPLHRYRSNASTTSCTAQDPGEWTRKLKPDNHKVHMCKAACTSRAKVVPWHGNIRYSQVQVTAFVPKGAGADNKDCIDLSAKQTCNMQ